LAPKAIRHSSSSPTITLLTGLNENASDCSAFEKASGINWPFPWLGFCSAFQTQPISGLESFTSQPQFMQVVADSIAGPSAVWSLLPVATKLNAALRFGREQKKRRPASCRTSLSIRDPANESGRHE
jgi:hypothetical protein